jgi:hypothetical protein
MDNIFKVCGMRLIINCNACQKCRYFLCILILLLGATYGGVMEEWITDVKKLCAK